MELMTHLYFEVLEVCLILFVMGDKNIGWSFHPVSVWSACLSFKPLNWSLLQFWSHTGMKCRLPTHRNTCPQCLQVIKLHFKKILQLTFHVQILFFLHFFWIMSAEKYDCTNLRCSRIILESGLVLWTHFLSCSPSFLLSNLRSSYGNFALFGSRGR